MISGSVDENRRCKRQYPKELRPPHPLLKRLSSGSADTRPMSYPLTLWPTGQRMEQVNANAYFPRSYKRPSVGQTVWPTVHRILRTGERRRGEDPLTTRAPRSAKWWPQKTKNLHFPRVPDPLAPFLLAGGGGRQSEIMLNVRAFLAFRQLPALARRVRGAPANSGNRPHGLPSVCGLASGFPESGPRRMGPRSPAGSLQPSRSPREWTLI